MIYIKLLLTAFFWGGTFVAGRLLASGVEPQAAAFVRFGIASLFLLTFTIRAEGRLPLLRKNQVIPVVLLGLTGVFAYNILFFTGLKYIQAGRAALIIATNPVLISLLSALFFKESLNWIKGTGICLSVFGAMIVIAHGKLTHVSQYHFGFGELMIIGCVVSWVAYSLIGKIVMRGLSPLVSVAYSALVGTILLAVPALNSGLVKDIGQFGATEWGSLFYLGFFGTVLGFFWYYQGIERIGPMRASVFINFVPVSAILLSATILGETITPSLLIGAALVISGVYCTNASSSISQVWRKLRS
jgi:drug/metabolite transporter (DMT)-like permease